MIIAIDPGASGGIAWQDEDKRIYADPMPTGLSEIWDYLKGITTMVDAKAIVERVGGYMPGNSGPAAVAFARHCGHLDAILYALSIPLADNPTPKTWMSAIGVPAKMEKKERKARIKEAMARKYPHLKVTLKTSDALGILTYYLKKV